MAALSMLPHQTLKKARLEAQGLGCVRVERVTNMYVSRIFYPFRFF